MRNLYIEAFVIGLIVAVFGILYSKLISKGNHPRLDSPYLISMLMVLFLTGATIHLLFEWVGANEQFCRMMNLD